MQPFASLRYAALLWAYFALNSNAFAGVSPQQAQVYLVDSEVAPGGDGSSWAAAFKYLQDALAVATSGDQIWVAVGTYRPDQGAGLMVGDRTATFRLPNGVALLGGFAGHELTFAEREGNYDQTVLSGFLQAAQPGGIPEIRSERILTAENVGPGTRLDGFRIEKGRATIEPRAAGVLWSGDAQILNCNFVGHQISAVSDGGMLGGSALLLVGSGVVSMCRFDACQTVVLGD
jgi:hypothetical protein